MLPENKKKKKVLVTGIRGFVGTNLLNYLESEPQIAISGTSRSKSSIEHLVDKGVDTYSFDDIFEKQLSFNTYVHLSGKVFDLDEKGKDSEYFEANYENTKRLFNYFLKDPQAKKFIFLSTIHVLAEIPEKVLDEDYIPKPFTPYGKSKLMAEEFLLKQNVEGKKVYVLRPAMIHGPGNKGNLNLLFHLVNKGIPYPLGSINNKRSFVSVDNLSFIIKEIISEEIDSGLYHIADDNATYTHELIELMARELNKKVRIWNISPIILRAGAKIGNFIPLPLNEHRLNKLTGDFLVSNNKIKRAIGKDLPVKSMDGLEKTISSLKSNLDSNT